MASFMDECVAGRAQPQAVDDAVDAWHEGRGEGDLAAWLGLDAREAALWVRVPGLLPRLVARRRRLAGGGMADVAERARAFVGLDLPPTREGIVALLVAALGVGAGLGHDPCTLAREALALRLSSDIDGPGADGPQVDVDVVATTGVVVGPDAVAVVRLEPRFPS